MDKYQYNGGGSVTEDEWLKFLEKESIVFNADGSRWLVICQKLNAANIQISRSIDLYLDQEDYLCATTLAGAANGLLREMLKVEYKLDPLGVTASMASSLDRKGSKKPVVSSIIRAELYPVNWLKHYCSGKTKAPEVKSFDEEGSAFNTVLNALCSYAEFLEVFLEEISEENREKTFVSPQMRRWEEFWGNEESVFSW